MTDPYIIQTAKKNRKGRHMAILSAFSLEQLGDRQARTYRVHPLEEVLCPSCHKDHLIKRDDVWRPCRICSGNRFFFLIPRGRCPSCGTVRRELPIILCPDKRYSAATIYRLLMNPHSLDKRRIRKAKQHPNKDTLTIWRKWAGPGFCNLADSVDYYCFSKNAQIIAAQSLAAFLSNTG